MSALSPRPLAGDPEAFALPCGACTLRAWRPADAPALHRHANSPAVWENLRDVFPEEYTLEDARRWIAMIQPEWPPRHLAIEVGGESVGAVGIEPGLDIQSRSAEIGYWLGIAFWGRGIATEALRGATEYAFATFALVRIFATPFLRNPASIRVLEKAGYRREGILHQSAVKEGIILDQALYARIVMPHPAGELLPGPPAIASRHEVQERAAGLPLPLPDDLR